MWNSVHKDTSLRNVSCWRWESSIWHVTLRVITLDAKHTLVRRIKKIQGDFDPNMVANYSLIGYENRDVADQNFRNVTVDTGEIDAGNSVTALYAVTFHLNADDAACNCAGKFLTTTRWLRSTIISTPEF